MTFKPFGVVLAVLLAAMPVTVRGQDRYTPETDEPCQRVIEGVREILDAGWEAKLADELQTVVEVFETVRSVTPDDARMPYAMGLVHIKHSKYSKSMPFVSVAVQMEPRDLRGF